MSQQQAAVQNGIDDAMTLPGYEFPTRRLKNVLSDSGRTPLVLVACGSFSPITYLHLRIFEMALDWVRYNTEFEVIEPLHKEYLPTAKVLDHFDHELNEVRGGVEDRSGQKRKVRVALLAGDLWAPKDLDHILGHYGAFIVEREGTDIDDALASLQQWRDNIYVIHQLVKNDVSSTRIRLFLKRDMSIRYLVPEPVIKYIEANGLYSEEADKDRKEEKGKEAQASSSS
ncbi:Nicotinamide/nicotinic acid mononucleotide adenylyltransferase 1 [Neofusicoccum ribis]|uniref:Nicotinamide/nicotinic acid mononucleotide adenylyltransferase 1 n=1 Tax=Neofusicoccum ribis TaxID=45134 RepID=A0ABR3SPI6_9PEZI